MVRKRLTLKTPQQIRRSLNRVANMVLNGDIDPKTANTIIYACNSILQGIKTYDQEQKITELEMLINDQEKNHIPR